MPFVEHLMWMGFKDGLRGLTAPSPALGYRPGIMENSMVERSKDAPENAVGDDLGTVPDHAAVSGLELRTPIFKGKSLWPTSQMPTYNWPIL